MQKKMLLLLIAVLLALCIMPAFADTALQDGLQVVTTTDKAAYAADELISMSLSVTNTNDYEITDVNLSVDIPVGYAVHSGTDNKTFDKIVAGGVASLDVTFTPFALPDTGDAAQPALWGVLLLASVGGMLWFALNHRQTAKRMMSFALVVALASTCCGFDFIATAKAEDSNIQLVTTVTVDSADLDLVAHVDFGYRGIVTTLAVDEENHLAKQDNTVIFTAESPNNATIHLYESGKDASLGVMHDDGRNGDEIPMDGVYSLKLNVTADEAMIRDYYAMADGEKTDLIKLYFYERPNQEDAEKVKAIRIRIDEIKSQYCDENGNVLEIVASLDAIEALAIELLADKLLLEYTRTDSAVFFRTRFGLTLSYIPQSPNTDSNGVQAMGLYTFQPCLAGYSADISSFMPYPDDAAERVDDVFSNYTFSSGSNRDDARVTLASIRAIGPNSVVLWHGHGAHYNRYVGSLIITGEPFDWDAWWWDLNYFGDCVRNLIIENGNMTCITGLYIDEYCGNMDNSLIYIAACQSGLTSKLPDAFLDKGATAVVANSETIYTVYNLSVQKSIIERMCETNANTGKYYTLSQARSYALGQLGNTDNAWLTAQGGTNAPDKQPAQPRIFGGTLAENYRFGEGTGSLNGKVKSQWDSSNISGAKVQIKSESGNNAATAFTNSSGSYTIDNLSASKYQVKITKANYLPFTGTVTIEPGRTTYLPTYLMLSYTGDLVGTASGTVTDAITGDPLDNVTITVAKGWDNDTNVGVIGGSFKTNSSGTWRLQMPAGNYTFRASRQGYADTIHNIIIQPGANTANQDFSMTPSTTTSNQYRIKLTWGEDPRDLDSHMYGTLSNGSTFHTYYVDKDAYDGNVHVCNLDRDDTTSYGPEHVTLTPTTSEPYYYFIHRYAGSGSIATSDACIEVYEGNTLIRTFNAPTNLGTSDYWNVFAIVDGRIVVRNTITSSPDVSYASISPLSVQNRSFEFELPAK